MSGEAIIRLMVALAIGLVVGLERGWQEREAEAGSRTAGIRTYGLSGLLGGASASLAGIWSSPLLFAICFLVHAAIFAWYKREEGRADENFSVTGVIAGLVVFAAGGMAVAGDLYAAGAVGVGTAGLLAAREYLHGWLRRLTWVELRSALLVLTMTVIILPVLPNRALDPYGGFNPWQVWLFTVMTAALSYAGYVATKIVGPSRGLAFLGLAGGLVSSTVVTVTLANRSRAEEAGERLAGAALLSAMVSILRVTALASVINAGIVPFLAPASLVAALVLGVWGGWLLRRSSAEASEHPVFTNPFELKLVFLVGFSVAAASLALAWLSTHVPHEALLAAAAFAGLLDVDALAMSTARLVPAGVAATQAALVIATGLAANAGERAVYAGMFGSRRFSLHFVGASAAAVIFGAAALLWLVPS